MKKVIVTQRSIYHKIASIEVEVPNNINDDEVGEWLLENEDSYTNKIDTEISNTNYEFGFGMGNGMDEIESESEWRYDVVDSEKPNRFTIGGHL